jgi:hypothetical protein
MALEELANVDLQSVLGNPWVLAGIMIAELWKFSWYGLSFDQVDLDNIFIANSLEEISCYLSDLI